MKKGFLLLLILTILINGVPIQAEEVNQSENLTITLVGDLLMDGSVRRQIEKNGLGYPWEMVKEYFQESELTIGNLETSITTRGTKWPDKQFNFRSHPNNLKAMKEAGIDVVTLANNHTLDFGYEGLLDTLRHLDKYEIQHAGGGKNKKEAIEGTIIERNGLKIGVLSFSRVVPDVRWYATSKRAGIVGAYDPHIEEVLNRVKEMKEEADIVILSVHWGIERSTVPRKQEIQLARKAIDAGADIIMGHHPHVLQGIEIYKGKPIIYSLGNFVFGSRDQLTSTTMIAQININEKNIDNIEIIPCSIVNGRPIPLTGNKRVEKIDYINTLSKDFKTKINKEGIIKINKQ
ncbi:CapA family protein [Tissierella sp. MSJ-40]|uniref:CapA family protein n=1 Tax=Tissierella simiarum TaxID=2841534 RepID=A0ABS6E8L3_9FIRM|nr:CapA family protein [Tissierella simiarum]MBU5439246.1 CapA family protein [Tissierella simiarum]